MKCKMTILYIELSGMLYEEGALLFFLHNDPRLSGGRPSPMPEGYRFGWCLGSVREKDGILKIHGIKNKKVTYKM